MKTTAIIGLVSLTLILACAKSDTPSEGALEYEHNLRTSTSVEDMPVDMSEMKAMGKCGADQKAAKRGVVKNPDSTKANLEYEHNLKSSDSVEDMPVDMSEMKAMGKCGADQKAAK
jgi:hypothetical protein